MLFYSFAKKLFLSVLLVVSFALSSQKAQAQCLNVTISIFNQENDLEYTDSVLIGTALAIHQRAAPILASKILVQKFLLAAHLFKQKISQIEPEKQPDYLLKIFTYSQKLFELLDEMKSQTKTPEAMTALETIAQEAKTDLNQKIQEVAWFFLYTLGEKFIDSNWTVFEHALDDYYLLIPKTYTQSSAGLNLNNWTPTNLNEITASVATGNIEKKDDYTINLDTIISTFIPDSGLWNIMLMGHGNSTHCRKKDTHKKDFIADLTIEQFNVFLRFLNTNVKTATFVYKTCYSGGSHLIKPYIYHDENNFVHDVNLNFTVICCCLLNHPVLFTFKDYILKNNRSNPAEASPGQQSPQDNFPNLMGELNKKIESFFHSRNLYASLNAYATAPTEENQNVALRNAIQAITPPLTPGHVHKKVTPLAWVRYPNTRAFRPFNFDKVVHVTRDLIRETQQQEIIIDTANKLALLLETQHITTPVHMPAGHVPNIISLHPAEAYHIFEEIKTGESLESFVKKGFFFHPKLSSHEYFETPYTQIFFIKRLTYTDEESGDTVTLKNLIIIASQKEAPTRILIPQESCLLEGISTIDKADITWIEHTDQTNVRTTVSTYQGLLTKCCKKIRANFEQFFNAITWSQFLYDTSATPIPTGHSISVTDIINHDFEMMKEALKNYQCESSPAASPTDSLTPKRRQRSSGSTSSDSRSTQCSDDSREPDWYEYFKQKYARIKTIFS